MLPASIKRPPVRFRTTGHSSKRFGPCEVCKTPASDVWLGTYDDGVTYVFGHEFCVLEALRTRRGAS